MNKELDFKLFSEAVKKKVDQELGCLYEVSLVYVIKNNNTELRGLCIKDINNNIAPIIYLNDYFNNYQDGRELDEIITDVIETCKRSNKCLPSINNDDFAWNNICNNVILRLVNYDMNKEVLQGIPHKVVLEDLAVTFHVLTGSNSEGIQSFCIKNELFDSFGISIEELYQSALTKTMSYFRASIRGITEVITSMIASENMDSDEYAGLYDRTNAEGRRGDMYVLTNNIGLYGATTMLYPDIIKGLADEFECDLYILPSSVHEVLLVLDFGLEYNEGRLKEMVYDINREVLNSVDILSDSVYRYTRATNKIVKL